METDAFRCEVCDGTSFVEVEDFSALSRVTSDCIPFQQGGRLRVCDVCGTMQKIPDERWLAEIGEIYRKYDIYHQSGGIEQSVFDSMTGQPKLRSVVLMDRLVDAIDLKPMGRLLDFGCGNGATLAALSAIRPQWSLFGLDLDDRNIARYEEIPGFSGLYTEGIEEVPDRFDLIVMIHSLEHIQAPRVVLSSLREKLSTDGWLFVQVPDAEQNPFDLVVADHLCHFTAHNLLRLVDSAGFAVERVETDWIKKEISLCARPAGGLLGRNLAKQPLAIDRVREHVHWLRAVVDGAHRAAVTGRFGLFGTSISATWLFGQLADEAEFFVNEDPAKAGGQHMRRPIWRPHEAPTDAAVYLALIPMIARTVRKRLRDLSLRLYLPPAFLSSG